MYKYLLGGSKSHWLTEKVVHKKRASKLYDMKAAVSWWLAYAGCKIPTCVANCCSCYALWLLLWILLLSEGWNKNSITDVNKPQEIDFCLQQMPAGFYCFFNAHQASSEPAGQWIERLASRTTSLWAVHKKG